MRLALKVVDRFLRKQADRLPGQRELVRKRTRPVNDPKGISSDIIREEGKSRDVGESVSRPDPKDVQPSDVFSPPLPRDVSIRNLMETGQDLTEGVERQIEKGKGYQSLNNLSQYLIETEGLR